MPQLTLSGRFGEVPAWAAIPGGDGPWPGVVVIHDADGMGDDVRDHAAWLAEAGYLAVAPDLYRGGSKVRCMVRIMWDMARGKEERATDAIGTTRRWIATHDRCTGKVGVIGFCMGGGFALMVAPSGDFDASAPNYGAMTKAVRERLPDACPIVASFGGRDPTLKGAAAELEALLTEYGIPHDVKEYPDAGHGFMNQHDEDEMPWLFTVLGRLSRTGYDPEATKDARRRIISFFDEHLRV